MVWKLNDYYGNGFPQFPTQRLPFIKLNYEEDYYGNGFPTQLVINYWIYH